MKVVLMRHGIAAEQARTDDERPLTAEGTRKVRKAARALARLGIRPDVVAHSGLVRARQTAELVAQRVKPRQPLLVQSDALHHSADPRAFFDLLAKLRVRSAVCVGHAPNLDRVVALACGATGRLVTALGKAAAVELELPDSGRPAGRIVWLLPPKMLRRLAE
jgi:phosphohistidine phosphatase